VTYPKSGEFVLGIDPRIVHAGMSALLFANLLAAGCVPLSGSGPSSGQDESHPSQGYAEDGQIGQEEVFRVKLPGKNPPPDTNVKLPGKGPSPNMGSPSLTHDETPPTQSMSDQVVALPSIGEGQ